MFGLERPKHFKTLISPMLKLYKDKNRVSVDPTLYRSMIGGLLYLITSHLDISYNVGLCARYKPGPKESYIAVVKRIIHYVSGALDFGLWHSHDTNVNLIGFSNMDQADNVDDRKSTRGGCFYLGNNIVSWHSKK